MIKHIFTFLLISAAWTASAQTDSTKNNVYRNAAGKMMSMDRKLTIGLYGNVDYNQPINPGSYNNGNLDVHRVVFLFGYKFNDRMQLITELELEHVEEVSIEQAFLDYRINNFMNLRAGLMLIPIGIINEYHEPTTFNGVERPLLDKYIVPSTWREIGAGFAGNIMSANIRYQAYIINGFSSYGDGPALRGKDAFRKGRQKGAESFMSSPNFTAKIEYYGLRSFNIGISGYFGNTQSSLYNGIEKSNSDAVARADSSVVGIAMLSMDGRYNRKGLMIRGQLNYANITNTNQYNNLSIPDGKTNDLGSALFGYYIEAGYNVFQSVEGIKSQLVPFIRYSEVDTHYKVAGDLPENNKYHRTIITTGIGWKVTPGTVFKADMQFLKTKADASFDAMLNLGIGFWF